MLDNAIGSTDEDVLEVRAETPDPLSVLRLRRHRPASHLGGVLGRESEQPEHPLCVKAAPVLWRIGRRARRA